MEYSPDLEAYNVSLCYERCQSCEMHACLVPAVLHQVVLYLFSLAIDGSIDQCELLSLPDDAAHLLRGQELHSQKSAYKIQADPDR